MNLEFWGKNLNYCWNSTGPTIQIFCQNQVIYSLFLRFMATVVKKVCIDKCWVGGIYVELLLPLLQVNFLAFLRTDCKNKKYHLP